MVCCILWYTKLIHGRIFRRPISKWRAMPTQARSLLQLTSGSFRAIETNFMLLEIRFNACHIYYLVVPRILATSVTRIRHPQAQTVNSKSTQKTHSNNVLHTTKRKRAPRREHLSSLLKQLYLFTCLCPSRNSNILSPRSNPGEPIELLLILRSKLGMHRCERRLFLGELFVEVGRIRGTILKERG